MVARNIWYGRKKNQLDTPKNLQMSVQGSLNVPAGFAANENKRFALTFPDRSWRTFGKPKTYNTANVRRTFPC